MNKFDRAKKRCGKCGCLMEPDSELDICEVCLDELFGDDLLEEEIY